MIGFCRLERSLLKTVLGRFPHPAMIPRLPRHRYGLMESHALARVAVVFVAKGGHLLKSWVYGLRASDHSTIEDRSV